MPTPEYDNLFIGQYIRAIENPDSIGFSNGLWLQSPRKADDPNNRGFGVDVKYNKAALNVVKDRNGKWLSEQEERDLRNSHIRESMRVLDKWTPKMLASPPSNSKSAMAAGMLYRGDGIKSIVKDPAMRNAYYSGSDTDFSNAVEAFYRDRSIKHYQPERAKNHTRFMESYQPQSLLQTDWNKIGFKPNFTFAEGGFMYQPKDAWDALSMREKAMMIGVAVENGITNMPDIRKAYNEFAEGGDTENDEEELPPIVPFEQKPEAIITPDQEYNQYLNTLPDNQRFTPNDAYDSYLYWKLNGRPRNFEEAYNKGMFHYDHSDNGYHANSIAFGEDDVGYFMKPKTHDTVHMETDWYNKGIVTEEGGKRRPVNAEELKELEDFRRRFELTDDPSRPNYFMYAPRKQEHSLGGPLVEWALNEYAKGGGIHIKPSHRGRLTELKKRTGKSEAELYRTGNAATRKMITFARNARKWKHGDGGYLEQPILNLFAPGGNIFDGISGNTGQMQIGLRATNGWKPYTTEDIVANAERMEAIQDAIEKRLWNTSLVSNDATSVASGRPQNRHLEDRAVEGAKAHAAWEKEHPNLTAWGNVLGAVPLAVAAYPLASTIGSGVAALEDAAAATTVGQGLTNFLAPVATSTIAGAPALEWANIGLSSLSAAHGASQAIEDGGISPMTALEIAPMLQVAKPVTEAAMPYYNASKTYLQNEYPAIFDPYTSWDATLGYHGDNIFSRAIGTMGRRYGYTPKAEMPELHRRLNIHKPSGFRMTDDGRFIMSSGRTGEGHDGIVNFGTSEAARSHSSHKALSGVDDFIVDPRAIGNVEFKSIQPSDTFFEVPELAVDPKYVTFVSGNPETLNFARSIGMRTLSSPRLRALQQASLPKEEGGSGLMSKLFSAGRSDSSAGARGVEIQRLSSMRGAPTIQDYAFFENQTGLNSGVIPNRAFNAENAESILGRWGRVGRSPVFNHVIYDPATNIEALYRKAKIGEGTWEAYYDALNRLPSAKSYTGDLLDWSADKWFSRRVGGFDAEDVARLSEHTPEYLNIEKTAKANGTWLKNADGSDWQGFIDSRGKVSKDPHVWVMQQSEAGQKWSDEMLGTGMKSDRVAGFPTYDGEMWAATNPKVPQTFMSELKEPDFAWHGLLSKLRYGYIPQWKMNLERALDFQKGRAFGITVPKDMKVLSVDAAGRDWNKVTPLDEGVYMTARDYVKDFLKGENQAIRINNVNEWHQPFGINTDDLILGESTPRKIWEGNNGDFNPIIFNGYKSLGGYLNKRK